MFRRLLFELRYRLGRPRWDTGVVPPEVRRVVEDEALPPGRALDLGCGTGTSSVYLAERGWRVVGIDFAPRAIAGARHRAAAAGVEGRVRFVVADVTSLPDLGLFDLAIDVGCLHALPSAARTRYAAHVGRSLRPDAAYLLYAFRPADGGPGAADEEVRGLFARDFDVVAVEEGVEEGLGRLSAWYRLRRRGAAPQPGP